MIKKIDITNGYGETLSLDLFQPELSGFAVREISGLGPVQATVSMADYASKPGGRFQGSRLGTREISFDLVFLDSLASIEQVRHQSYRYFPIGEKIEMTFTTDEREVTTTGYVENNEPAIWDEDFEGATIDVVCESPFLRGKDMIIKNLASSYKSFHFPSGSLKEPELLFGYIKVGSDIQITNSGEQECGCIFNIIALEDFSNPLIYNDLDGTYFGLMINVDEGDTVVINTRVGEKSAKLIRNGQEYNVINYLKTGSTWFQLKRGKNQFSIGQADTYTKAQSGNTVTINADRKNYELNDIRMVLPMSQKNANKASSTKPKDIKVPTGFNLSATKTFWSDEDTDTEKYDVNSKSASFSYSLNDLFSHAIDENGNAAKNRAPLAFGAGYLQISYDKEKHTAPVIKRIIATGGDMVGFYLNTTPSENGFDYNYYQIILIKKHNPMPVLLEEEYLYAGITNPTLQNEMLANNIYTYQEFLTSPETAPKLLEYVHNGQIVKLLPIAEDEVFILGDNRKVSQDSSSYGAVALSSIQGKVNCIFETTTPTILIALKQIFGF